uniref:ZP domain-containing protein n=1 Tax=Bursaphelenchus xylophilus TaxID=6326 RepID=A0A1I7SGD4_BURXY
MTIKNFQLFVTKIDRAYNVNCFYMEKKQDVNIEFGVSELTTQSIAQDATTPTCTYTIHRDSPNGPIIQYGKVGDIIYHKWECPSPMYKMLLSLCKAVDGKGKEYPLQDEHGCSTDRFLFPEVTYSNDVTTAMVETSAFNFPDQNNVAFTCKIQLCYQQDNCDSITPPRCGHNKDKDIELNGDSLHGNDLNDDQLISSTVSDERISSTSAEKSTERAFAGDTEATTLKATTTTTQGTTTSASTTGATTTKATTTQSSTTKSSTTTSTTTSATSTTSTTTTTAVPVKSASSTKLFIPADFPRPDALEEGSGEVDAWMVSDIPEASENRNDSAESTPPPVQVLKKNKKRTPQAQRPIVEETTTLRAASRQQRNATPRPSNLLDMDVTNDLTVIDDYLNNAEQATQAQKQVYRDLNETPFGRGVCFSPVALLCGVLLILLLFVSVIFVLFRSRRSSKYYGA